MNHFQGLRSQLRSYLVLVILIENIVLIGGMWVAVSVLHFNLIDVVLGAYTASIVMTVVITFAVTDFALQPLEAIWQLIVHLAPTEQSMPAPNVDKLAIGQALVSNLAAQVYQIATVAEHSESLAIKQSADLKANFIANNLPLPLFVINAEQTIVFANVVACKYLSRDFVDIVGHNVHSVLALSFPTDDTLGAWLESVKTTSVTAANTWDKVRLAVGDEQLVHLFDLAAYYNKGNTFGYETVLVLFDHTTAYSQDDQTVSFLALSVHELRTPLTLLRGYIEAFEEELRGKLNPELTDFMAKMNATSQQLTTFVNNILNVARVDSEQLVLRLEEADWASVIAAAVELMSLRAKVRGMTLKVVVDEGLPTVGVDRTSIQEVIDNLIDNAIKYSDDAKVKEITIHAYLSSEGLIETTVQDWGVGIPTSVIPHLFTKFYRDQHHRAQVKGTGLGLYLCKAIVAAHGGNIWVRSKEGRGTIFGFTLLPYAKLAAEVKNNDNKEIVRAAHGWIKNHSLYRR